MANLILTKHLQIAKKCLVDIDNKYGKMIQILVFLISFNC